MDFYNFLEKKILSFCLREKIENFILSNRDKNNYFSILADLNLPLFKVWVELDNIDQLKEIDNQLFESSKEYHDLIDLDLKGSILIGLEKKESCIQFVSFKLKAGIYPFNSSLNIPLCIHQGISLNSLGKKRNHFYYQNEKSTKALSDSYLINLSDFSFLEYSESDEEYSDYIRGTGSNVKYGFLSIDRRSVNKEYNDIIIKHSSFAIKTTDFFKKEYNTIPFSSAYHRTGDVSIVFENIFNKLIEKNIV